MSIMCNQSQLMVHPCLARVPNFGSFNNAVETFNALSSMGQPNAPYIVAT